MIERLFGEARRILILSERVDHVGRDADKALAMAMENRERIVRLETTMEIGLRMAGQQNRLPPQ